MTRVKSRLTKLCLVKVRVHFSQRGGEKVKGRRVAVGGELTPPMGLTFFGVQGGRVEGLSRREGRKHLRRKSRRRRKRNVLGVAGG